MREADAGHALAHNSVGYSRNATNVRIVTVRERQVIGLSEWG
jgi:hypothetical protein